MSFVGWVEHRRGELGLTYTEMAQLMSFDKAHLSRILHGQKSPPREEKTVRRIAAALDIPWQTLMFEALSDRVLWNLKRTSLIGLTTSQDQVAIQEALVKDLRKYIVIQ